MRVVLDMGGGGAAGLDIFFAAIVTVRSSKNNSMDFTFFKIIWPEEQQ